MTALLSLCVNGQAIVRCTSPKPRVHVSHLNQCGGTDGARTAARAVHDREGAVRRAPGPQAPAARPGRTVRGGCHGDAAGRTGGCRHRGAAIGSLRGQRGHGRGRARRSQGGVPKRVQHALRRSSPGREGPGVLQDRDLHARPRVWNQSARRGLVHGWPDTGRGLEQGWAAKDGPGGPEGQATLGSSARTRGCRTLNAELCQWCGEEPVGCILVEP